MPPRRVRECGAIEPLLRDPNSLSESRGHDLGKAEASRRVYGGAPLVGICREILTCRGRCAQGLPQRDGRASTQAGRACRIDERRRCTDPGRIDVPCILDERRPDASERLQMNEISHERGGLIAASKHDGVSSFLPRAQPLRLLGGHTRRIRDHV